MSGISKCKGCGKNIEWIEHVNVVTGEVKKIPLDPTPPTYRFNPVTSLWERSDAMVSHFATCKNANDFSKTKKEEPTQQSLTDTEEKWWEK